MTKTFDQMSSEELFALAQSRKMEEEKTVREKLKSELDVLRKKRRDMAAEYKKELARLDNKIEKLRTEISSSNASSPNKTSSTNVSASVLSILQIHKEMSTKDLQAELSKHGVTAANLSQTLGYLKRQGKITSPERAVYAIV